MEKLRELARKECESLLRRFKKQFKNKYLKGKDTIDDYLQEIEDISQAGSVYEDDDFQR